jgi:dTDP-4-dehydrorhamnose reductase
MGDRGDMKILLLGGKGMLGSDCQQVLSEEFNVISPEKKELDIVSWDRVVDKLHHTGVKLILNCAAFTDVDGCENHRDAYMVRKINVEGPRNLAQAAARFNCKIIHISSDYVFSGQKGVPQPYFEDDALEPVSVYGRSKMESEIAVKDNAPAYVIIRTGWLYGSGGNSFIKSILSAALNQKGRKSLRVVDDQFGSPTWTHRLAQQIRELIRADAKGTFHATSEGYCSRLECAEFVFNKLNMKVSLQPVSLQDYPQKARRPANCILENRLLKKNGLNVMADWKEDLSAFLDQFGDRLIKEGKAGTSGH